MAKTPDELEREMLAKYNKSMQSATDGAKITPIVCPHFYQKPCTLCDLTYAYFKAKLGKEHFLREKARNMNRKFRYFSNIILPQNPSEVVIFEYGDFLHKELFGHALDESSEYYGFLDPNAGRNFNIKKVVPPANKRQTSYTIEMRSQKTQIPDPSVLTRMHDLTNILDILDQNKAKILRQSDLPEGRTEMRMLPSWLGPKSKVFYMEIPFHYVNKDEFNAIQEGKVNPFADAGIKLSKSDEIIVKPEASATNWGGYEVPIQTKAEPVNSNLPRPPCFGTFDATSPICTDRCAKLGHVNDCKNNTLSKSDIQNEELRRVASRLYK